MAPAPTTSPAPAPHWRTRTVVAGAVIAMLAALGALTVGGGGDRSPAGPSLRPVLSAAGVPTPGPLALGAIAPGTGGVGPEAATPPSTMTGAAGQEAPTTAPPAAGAPSDERLSAEPAPIEPAGPGSAAAAPPAPTPPSTERPMAEEPAAPTTGTLHIQITPAEPGASRQVRVDTADGVEVLARTEVSDPITLELAPGPYVVYIDVTGPPYGPDEDGVELGGGSAITRDQVEVVPGRTTTVACTIC